MSESQVYDLEKRVALAEEEQGKVAQSLEAITTQTRDATEKLSGSKKALNDRLGEIEQSLSDVTKKLEKLTQALAAFDKFPTELDVLKNRLAKLELAATNEVSKPAANSRVPSEPGTAEPANVNIEPLKTAKKKRTKDAPNFETTLLSWNVESEGSDPLVIAKQLSEMNRYDIYGLSEVLPETIELFADAVGGGYGTIATRTGFNDRLQIIYNEKKYRLLRRIELNEINFEFRYRSPLVAHLQDRETGQQLMVMNNHLARGRAEVRTKQAEQLVQWARNQNVPIVAIGDYNFDYVFATRRGNDGFVAMLRDSIWQWVEPVELIDTNWFDNPKAPDGRDDYEGSMLDFAFVAGAAKIWKKECRVIIRPGDFPDDETTSDHRPFELKLSVR